MPVADALYGVRTNRLPKERISKMKCTVEKSKLLEHLQKVCNVVDRKTAMPILNNLYVEAKDDTLTFTATNLEIRDRKSVV